MIYVGVFSQVKTEMHFNSGVKWPENHKGVDDFKIGKANYWVANNQLHMEIEIKDDDLVFEGSQIGSDHVEVWFTGIEETHQVFRISDYDSSFFTDWAFCEFEHEDSTIELKKKRFIEHEKVAMPFYEYYYSEEEMAHLNSSHVLVSRDLSGTAHYGFYKDSAKVYDAKSAYSLGYSSQIIPEFEIQATDSGYLFKMTCSAESFFTIDEYPIKDIKCNVVIFDKDKDGLSIHTFSNIYKWGEVGYLKKLEFEPTLKTNLPKEWGWITKSMENNYNLYGVFNGSNWELRKLYYEKNDWYDLSADIFWEDFSLQYDYFLFDGDSFVFFWNEGQNLIHKPNTTLWIQTEADFEFVKDSAFIRFADGGLGFYSISYFLQNPYGRGPCGSCEHEMLTVQRLSEGTVKRIFEVDANMGNLETWWPDEFMFPKEYVPDFSSLKWNKEKQSFNMKLFDEYVGRVFKLEFGWNEDWKPCVFSLEKIPFE